MRRTLALLLAGCGAGDPAHDTHHHEPAESPCAQETRAVDLAVGDVFAGDAGSLQIEVVALDPAPPVVGPNDWTFAVASADGEPVAGCALTVEATMPDHGHGTDAPTVDEADPGVFVLGGLDLRMGGFWALALALDCDGLTDTVSFGVCVES